MTRKRKPTPLGPAWLADMTIAFKGWQVALPLAVLSWMWRHWRGVGSVALAVLLFAWTQEPVLAIMALGVVYGLAKWKPAGRKARWWDEKTLATAMVTAGILSRKGDALPALSRSGRPVHTDHGTTVAVDLPDGQHLGGVLGKRISLASALRVPDARLSVFALPDDPANRVHIHVGTAPKSAAPPPVASAERTVWQEPVVFSYDSRGRNVAAKTFQRNSMFGGKPGMGKTATGRVMIAHFLLDPSATVMIVDGKGSIDDYGACRAMCQTFISGTDEEVVPDTIAMLEGVFSEIQRRNATGGQHDGILVVLEEIQDVRAECSKAQLERLDALMGRVIRKGRAVGVVLLTLTQKPSGQDVSTGFRSQQTQGLAFRMQPDDYRMVLGSKPTVALPAKPGQAIWIDDGGDQELVTCYHLTDSDWRKVCKRAAVLRAPLRPTLVLAPPPQPPPAGAALVDEVVAILADNPRGLKPSVIHERLSPETREAVGNEQRLGFALREFPDHVERARDGNDRVWRLTDGRDLSARVW